MSSVLRLVLAFPLALFAGKLAGKLKLPSILGWLIAGMILGPHGIALIDSGLLDAVWYERAMRVLECAVGLMIGTELVWKKIKRSGASIIITTLTQSLGTFFLVSLVFGVIFSVSGIPLYLAFLFGGIALATAPAPALSIVREFRTKGPVTDTLIPMAVLDDMVGCVVFFSVIAVTAGQLSAGEVPVANIALVIVLPLVMGGVIGIPAGMALKKERSSAVTLGILAVFILTASLAGFVARELLPAGGLLNFMLIGMAFSAVFSNLVSEKRLERIMEAFNPVLGIAMMFVILNLGAPLDYHLIMGAGAFTAIYIAARACGKYFGAYFGARMTKSPDTVRRCLGFTLLPHSGVSLVFTGVAVSVLSDPAPECAQIIQGTIAAAAVLNELIAVFAAKKGFEWAGELDGGQALENDGADRSAHTVITISRQYGSGGREVGKRLAEQLGIPFYDSELIEMTASTSPIDRSYFEDGESKGVGSLLHGISNDVSRGLSLSDRAFLHQSEVIRKVAAQGACVIVGRCADVVLRERGNLLTVFLYAEPELRRQRIRDCYREDPEEMERIDRKREDYYNFYSGQKFGDRKNYHICLNSGALGVEACAAMIRKAYEEREKEGPGATFYNRKASIRMKRKMVSAERSGEL